MSDESDTVSWQAMQISETISPHLAGLGPVVTGAVLADLVAIWLAGHFANVDDPDNPENDRLRENILEGFIEGVRALIVINEERLREVHGMPPKKGQQ